MRIREEGHQLRPLKSSERKSSESYLLTQLHSLASRKEEGAALIRSLWVAQNWIQ